MNFVCIGDCGIDHYRSDGARRPGGITLNFALHARRCLPDDDIHVVTALGTDDASSVVRSALAARGVRCDVTTLEGATPVQHITLAPDGERMFVGYEAGVLPRFRPTPRQRDLVERADWVVAPHFLQIAALFDVLLALPRRGRMAVDFADFGNDPDFELLRAALPRIDVAFFGLQEADTEILNGIVRLAAEHARLLVVTLGAAGSCAAAGSEVHRCGAVAVDSVVDTTGAGDAFAAAFLSRHCYGGPVPECLEAGARRAAHVIGQVGGH